MHQIFLKHEYTCYNLIINHAAALNIKHISTRNANNMNKYENISTIMLVSQHKTVWTDHKLQWLNMNMPGNNASHKRLHTIMQPNSLKCNNTEAKKW